MDPTKTVAPPTHCPACQSVNLVTTSKTIDAETYWRCSRCGEVWNAQRRSERGMGYRRPARW